MTHDDALAAALHADGPAPELADELALFGRFIGSWDLTWTGASSGTAVGELHFGWVLGGRAVQDVWIVPGPGQPGAGRPPFAFHGSTIRFYDRALGAWRSTWVEPINGRVRRFIGVPDAGDIVLRSEDDEPFLRWRFTDIAHGSFRWQGEISHDRGRTWELEEEMHAVRRDE
jgi:hypothetical protein